MNLKKSNYGRNYGWNIIYNSTVIAELINCKSEDMFWDSYELKILEKEHEKQIQNFDNWKELIIKNKELDFVVNDILVSTSLDEYFENKTDRISIRNLYIKQNTISEKIMNIIKK